MYKKDQIESLIGALLSSGIARKINDGRVVTEIPDKMAAYEDEAESKKSVVVTLVKGDGSTLYISRDLASALDRIDKYRFDKMFYVVEDGQSHHFQNLFALTKISAGNKSSHLEHVKFGRIQGQYQKKKIVLIFTTL